MTANGIVIQPEDGRRFAIGGGEPARAIVESGLADFSMFEQTIPPDPRGVPLHCHNSYDEGFYVVEGEVEFVAGETTGRCGAGAFVFIPRGVAHSFRNASTSAARMLVVGSSGVQALVEELAPLVNKVPLDAQKVIEAFARHDSELL